MSEQRLIDANALKETFLNDVSMMKDNKRTVGACMQHILWLINNAPTVPLPDFKAGYKQAIIDGKTNYSRPQGECEKCKFNHSEICDTCSRKYSDNYAEMKGGAE